MSAWSVIITMRFPYLVHCLLGLWVVPCQKELSNIWWNVSVLYVINAIFNFTSHPAIYIIYPFISSYIATFIFPCLSYSFNGRYQCQPSTRLSILSHRWRACCPFPSPKSLTFALPPGCHPWSWALSIWSMATSWYCYASKLSIHLFLSMPYFTQKYCTVWTHVACKS